MTTQQRYTLQNDTARKLREYEALGERRALEAIQSGDAVEVPDLPDDDFGRLALDLFNRARYRVEDAAARECGMLDPWEGER
jgi:hypothetical protein